MSREALFSVPVTRGITENGGGGKNKEVKGQNLNYVDVYV